MQVSITMPQSLEDRILVYLDDKESSNTLQLSEGLNEDHQKIIGAVKSLESLEDDIIRLEQKSKTKIEITNEGKAVLEGGSHEAIVFALVPTGEDGILAEELMDLTEPAICKIGLSKAIANGWMKTVKDHGKVKVLRIAESIEDNVKNCLTRISEGKCSELNCSTLADLKKRKLITRCDVKFFKVMKGSGFTLEITKQEAELTSEMLLNGNWRYKKFKKYNFKSMGIPPNSGHLHPLLKMRTEIRGILLEMGFSEMASNHWVETSFWNFDALFVPQKHPSRDTQDTFFMKSPLVSQRIPKDYMERVRKAHIGQDYNTKGHSPVWKSDECSLNCLRTHTTSITARLLQAIGSEGRDFNFNPVKMFSVDRVFRNETLDHTHLAEFHQVEGIIADYDLSLANLFGLLKEFVNKMGFHKLRFKPAYNPYTEPSVEVFAYHEGLKKWIEVGNSGIFRPEVVLPMGIPEKVRVLAWGLSLERPTMIKYGINDIRQLAGHRVDLRMVHDNFLCILNREN